jgi:1,6-anhydro-N-acetylmuramate kinase
LIDYGLLIISTAIDVALCKIDSIGSSNDVKIELLSFTEVPVTSSLRSQILSLCRPGSSTTLAEICDLNFALGREFARAITDSGVDLAQVDLVASHGQTLWHIPDGEHKSTLQMAEPAVIARQTNK